MAQHDFSKTSNPPSPRFRKFEIELTETGRKSKIVMDGEDISDMVADISIHAAVADFTTVTVTYFGTVNYTPVTDAP
jgi:hypothetical protein